MTYRNLSLRSTVRVALGCTALLLITLITLPAAASGVCTNTSADNWFDYVVWNNDVVDAEGAWKVTNASSVQIQFYINDVLYQTSTDSGSSGTWHSWVFQDNFDECGTSHVFKARVCPRVYDNGAWTVCETHCTENATSNFSTYSCVSLDVDFDCDPGNPNGVVTLTADINDGNPPYQVEKFFPDSWYVSSSSTTSTYHSDGGRCIPNTYVAGIRITDDDGQVKSQKCWCAGGA